MSAARIYWPPVLSADVSEEGSLIEKAPASTLAKPTNPPHAPSWNERSNPIRRRDINRCATTPCATCIGSCLARRIRALRPMSPCSSLDLPWLNRV